MYRLALLLLLSLSLVHPVCWSAEADAGQAKAVAKIDKLGGNISIDERSPDRPVIGVDLEGTSVTDAELACIKYLPHVETLNLSETKLTAAGLENLRDLPQLQSLNLSGVKMTAAGLDRLRSLPRLKTLYLWGTRVTDADLGSISRDYSRSKSWTCGLPRLRMRG